MYSSLVYLRTTNIMSFALTWCELVNRSPPDNFVRRVAAGRQLSASDDPAGSSRDVGGEG